MRSQPDFAQAGDPVRPHCWQVSLEKGVSLPGGLSQNENALPFFGLGQEGFTVVCLVLLPAEALKPEEPQNSAWGLGVVLF